MMILQSCVWLLAGLTLALGGAARADDAATDAPDSVVEAALPAAATLVVIASGDGGWWGDLDTRLGERFAARGDAVVGIDTAIYFDTERTPAEWGSKLGDIVTTYAQATGADRVILVGWSYGADVIPLGYADMSDAAKEKVAGIVLLAPRQHANLSVTLSGRLGLNRGAYDLETALRGLPLDRTVCVKPDGAEETGCDLPAMAGASVLAFPGGHGFGGDAEGLVTAILAALEAH